MKRDKKHGNGRWFIAAFLIVNLAAILLIGRKESSYIRDSFLPMQNSPALRWKMLWITISILFHYSPI